MRLDCSAKRIESRDKHNKTSFSINKQKSQLCFTRGHQSVR